MVVITALDKSQADIAEDQRREVAVLRCRKMSHRQVARALAQAERVNPESELHIMGLHSSFL